ncbi:YlcI/YnfO family protein [Escherichia coli]|uniref:YlcI/YnfO family protein n=1 Tax=Escherichia coli TaxID=562 RepID=UPI000BE32685|nr:YlcI/YnfO family protein [Escherichia coli]
MSSKNRPRRTTTRNIRFPNQMIEQINIALDQKGSENFSAWIIESCRRELAADIKYARQLTIKKNDTQYALRWLFI